MTFWMTYYLNLVNQVVYNFFLPRLLNLINLLGDITLFFMLKYFPVWKVSNYADAYWFLYSNKKITYEVITQLNQK